MISLASDRLSTKSLCSKDLRQTGLEIVIAIIIEIIRVLLTIGAKLRVVEIIVMTILAIIMRILVKTVEMIIVIRSIIKSTGSNKRKNEKHKIQDLQAQQY